MKRYLVALLAVIGLSSASAQSDPFLGGAFNLEFVGGGTYVSLDAHYGDYGLFDSIGARGTVGLGLSPAIYLKLAGDVLIPFEVDSNEITPYAGAGFGLITRGGTIFNIHGLGGAEFEVSDQIGLFGEISPALYISGGTAFGVGLRFGANYHLD